jgi:hypothetical protein
VTFEGLRDFLRESGLNLTATLTAAEYNALVSDAWQSEAVLPGCRGVVVVGNAGRALWSTFQSSPQAKLAQDPLDHYTAHALREAAKRADGNAAIATYVEQRDGAYLPLIQIAKRAGFGSPGRLGILLHPEYGPWISIRGLLFLQQDVPPAGPLDSFAPCAGCPAPCARACHGQVIGPETVDSRRCFRTKILNSACRRACDARTACVVGPEHAFSDEQIAHHTRIRWRASILPHVIDVLLRP